MEWNFKNKTIRLWAIVGVVFIAMSVVVWGALVYGIYYLVTYDETASADGYAVSDSTAGCNVYAERIHGALDTYAPPEGTEGAGDVVGSEDIVFNIETAEKESEIKAVLVDIDSWGGTPVAADEITQALKALTKPSVAVIRGYGDSAAYWAATGADMIFAHPLSDVGSIGITQSYLENVGYNTKEGYTYRQLSLGQYKDMGDPNKPLTAEEKQIVMRQLEQNYRYFVETVAANRNLPVEEVKKLATGESWTGTEALQLKLIDQLGGLPEATAWLEKQIGVKPEFCW